jgi:hypothetical protein
LYLDRIAPETGNPEAIAIASDCFAGIHDLMWKIWGAAGGFGAGPAKAKEFAKPAVRKKIIAHLDEARELDERALASLKKAM